MIPTLFFLTVIYGLLLFILLKARGITVLWIFNLGIFLLYHIGFWSLRFQGDIYFLVNTSDRMEQIVPDIIIFTSISIFILLILNSRGVRSKKKDLIAGSETHLMERIIYMLSIIVISISAIMSLFINWASAPLFNIGTYGIEQLAVARSELFEGVVLELLAVPRYIMFYMIFPVLFYSYGFGIRVPKVVLFIGCLLGLLTLAKTFIVINLLCLFLGWWFRRGGFIPLIMAGIVLPSIFYIVVFVSYMTEVNRLFLEVFKVLLTRIIQVPIALVTVYKEIFYFDQGLRSSYWYTLIFGGDKVPIQQIAGHYLAPNAMVVPNAACGILGAAYPNIPLELHTAYFVMIIGGVALSSFFVSRLKNYSLRIAVTIIMGLQSLFILLTDPLTAFNSYGLMWSAICVFFIVYGLPFLKVASQHKTTNTRQGGQCDNIGLSKSVS